MAAACRAFLAGERPEEIQVAPLPDLPEGLAAVLQIKLLHGPEAAIRQAEARLGSVPPGVPRLPLQRALIEMELEADRDAQALPLLEEALAGNPQDGMLWYFRGIATRRLGRRDESHTAFTQAITLAPLEPRCWAGFGAGWLERGQYGHASRALRVACFLDRNNALFWGDLGQSEAARGHYEEAKESLTKAIDLGMGKFTNYLNRGICSQRVGDVSAAVVDWRLALAVDPNHARAEEVRKLIGKDDGTDWGQQFVFGDVE
jgi:tetratricopeptide (TPR) repeat protein